MRAARSWAAGKSPWSGKKRDVSRYFDAGGNGVAMRVIPHVIAGSQAPFEDLARAVALDGAATHGHPRALLGAVVYAFAAWKLVRSEGPLGFKQLAQELLDERQAWQALPKPASGHNGWYSKAMEVSGGQYEATWARTADEVARMLQVVLTGLDGGVVADDRSVLEHLGVFSDSGGAGTVSAAAAIYLASRYAVQPTQALLRASFLPRADTDTLAAMAGGLLGCLSGPQWLPRELLDVQDADAIKSAARMLASNASGAGVGASERLTTSEIGRIKAALEGGEAAIQVPGLGVVPIGQDIEMATGSGSLSVTQWCGRLPPFDETVYFKVLRKGTPERPRQQLDAFQPDASKQETSDGRHKKAPDGATIPPASVAVVKLSVGDVPRSVRFYRDALGLNVVKERRKFAEMVGLLLIDATYAATLTEGVVSAAPAPGTARISVAVPDIASARNRIHGLGGHVLVDIRQMPWGQQVFHCSDPDGYLVEVVDRL